MSQDKSDRNTLRTFGLFGLIVSDILVTTGIGVGTGYLLWHKLGWPWWVLLVTSLAGLAAAFYRLYKYSERDLK